MNYIQCTHLEMIIPAALLQLVPQLLILHLQPVRQSLEVFVLHLGLLQLGLKLMLKLPAPLLELIQLLLGSLCCLLPFTCLPSPIPGDYQLWWVHLDEDVFSLHGSYLASSASLENEGVSSPEAMLKPLQPPGSSIKKHLVNTRGVATPRRAWKPTGGSTWHQLALATPSPLLTFSLE